jgi:GGDEF domain-containing protein
MRFKNFIYHFLLVLIVICMMGIAGYFNLKSILNTQVEQQAARQMEFLEAQLNNPKNSDRLNEVIEQFGVASDGYSWVIDKNSNYILYPSAQDLINPYFRQRESIEINDRVIRDYVPAFIAGEGRERRMVISQALNSGNYLVVTKNMDRVDAALSNYLVYILATGILFLMISLVVLYVLSREIFKPLAALQEYSESLLVGEYLEKAESLEEPDVVSVAAVLEQFNKQVRDKKYNDANPLSGLPGNKSLYDRLFRRIESKEPIAVGFADINNFKAFKNRYGNEKAESIIRFVSTTIINALSENGTPSDNLYHLENERFIFITSPDRIDQICKNIIEHYDNQIKYFYDEKSREVGFIVSKNKEGVTGEYPMMPICMGVATNVNRPLRHPLQIGHIVGEIRNYLKGQNKSGYLIDRRKSERETELEGSMAPFSKDEIDQVERKIEQSSQDSQKQTAESDRKRKKEGKSGEKSDSSEINLKNVRKPVKKNRSHNADTSDAVKVKTDQDKEPDGNISGREKVVPVETGIKEE